MAAGMYILNLCLHDIDIHIDRSSPVWAGITAEGRWNIIKLRLSSRLKQRIRGYRLVAARMLAEVQSKVAEVDDVIRQAKKARNNVALLQASRTKQQLIEEIDFLESRLNKEQDSD